VFKNSGGVMDTKSSTKNSALFAWWCLHPEPHRTEGSDRCKELYCTAPEACGAVRCGESVRWTADEDAKGLLILSAPPSTLSCRIYLLSCSSLRPSYSLTFGSHVTGRDSLWKLGYVVGWYCLTLFILVEMKYGNFRRPAISPGVSMDDSPLCLHVKIVLNLSLACFPKDFALFKFVGLVLSVGVATSSAV